MHVKSLVNGLLGISTQCCHAYVSRVDTGNLHAVRVSMQWANTVVFLYALWLFPIHQHLPPLPRIESLRTHPPVGLFFSSNHHCLYLLLLLDLPWRYLGMWLIICALSSESSPMFRNCMDLPIVHSVTSSFSSSTD